MRSILTSVAAAFALSWWQPARADEVLCISSISTGSQTVPEYLGYNASNGRPAYGYNLTVEFMVDAGFRCNNGDLHDAQCEYVDLTVTAVDPGTGLDVQTLWYVDLSDMSDATHVPGGNYVYQFTVELALRTGYLDTNNSYVDYGAEYRFDVNSFWNVPTQYVGGGMNQTWLSDFGGYDTWNGWVP